LTLQIISYQIKDNMRNHGLIGLFQEWCVWWEVWLWWWVLALGVSAFSVKASFMMNQD